MHVNIVGTLLLLLQCFENEHIHGVQAVEMSFTDNLLRNNCLEEKELNILMLFFRDFKNDAP